MFTKIHKKFNSLSLKNKLLVIINSITLTILLVALLILIITEYTATKKNITNNFIVQTKLIGDYCVTPLAFFDRKGTEEILNRLSSLPDVKACFVFDEDNNIFASYKKDEETFFIKDFDHNLKIKNLDGELHISAPIRQNEKIFGTIYLVASLEPLNDLIINYIFTGFILLIFLLSMSFVFSYKLQSFISKPITELKQLAEEISKHPDYSMRIEPKYNDEVGELYNSFNNMLEQIHNRDVQQKNIENALRVSEREKDLILYAAPVGIAIIKNNKLSWANERITKITGYSVDELKDIDFEALFRLIKISDKSFREIVLELSNYGYSDFYGKFIPKQSKDIDIYCCIAPFDSKDLNVGLIITFLDVSEEMQSKEIIKKQLIDLEIKNAELERFAYTVSHDLKSPVITIKGFVGAILKDIQKQNFERISDDINRIGSAADKMKALLDDLLHFSKLGRQKNILDQAPMNELIDDTLELLHGVIKSKNAKITIQPDMPYVYGDLARIREVIQNLVENSIKYSGDKIPEIQIGYKIINNIDTYYVKDNGIGIKKEFQNRIFNIFEKLNTGFEGTGIGLAIVKKIIELHNGRIWVESEGIGCGSTFYFTLNEP